MSKEAIKLALGKIKSARDCHFAAIDTLLFEAEEILEKALAEQPAQQKPFGYIKPGEGDYEKVFSWNRNERNGYTQAVYTTPQPQPAQPAREWVDLTVIEQNELCRELGASRHQVRAIGAKLKEKNT